MPHFIYTAIGADGKDVRGTVEAPTEADALARVREMGHIPVTAVLDQSRPAGEALTLSRRRISGSDITTFTRQMSDLVSAGLPIDRALTVLLEQTDNPALVSVIRQAQTDIRAGKSLSEALAAHPRLFSPMYTNMLHAGEASGQLGEVASRLADFLEKEQVRRSHLISAMVYPTLLLSVAVLAMVFLLLFVVPRLSGVFDDLGSSLPLPTVILLGITGILGRYWWAILGALAFAWVSLKGFAHTDAGRRQIDAWVLRLPITGRVAYRIVVSRFARALGTLLGGGVPILDALQIAGQAAANRVTIDAAEKVRELVRQGEPVAEALHQAQHF
ncbi:MAG: type II secretion system F family protein, partial [Armatimonadota bacterium]|nr:type II secretion system F family protein [Armatimonadota bacterium]